jgi:acyl-CoA thioesterase-1
VAVRHRAVNRRQICGVLAAIWIVFFAFLAKAYAAEPVLLLMGDSLTAGYGLPHEQAFSTRLQAALEKAGHKVTLVEAGVSGDTSAGGRARLAWAIGGAPGGKVDAAILELGANDALRGLPPDQMKVNLAAMLDEFKRRGIPVLLAGMHAPPNLGEAYTREYDAVFASLSKSYDVVYYPFFLDGVAMKPELNQADGIHPNPTGVDIIVTGMLPSVEQLLKRASISAQ